MWDRYPSEHQPTSPPVDFLKALYVAGSALISLNVLKDLQMHSGFMIGVKQTVMNKTPLDTASLYLISP